MSGKNTRRALLTSALAILACVAMLVGTTFAWFTDTASTAVNKIQAGNLDIELQMMDNDGNWVNAEGNTLPFLVEGKIPAEGTQILWEPGCTYQIPELRIVNKGNLAIKAYIYISGFKSSGGSDVDLRDVLEWKTSMYDGVLSFPNNDISVATMMPNEEWNFNIECHMKEEAGNEYQGLSVEGIAVTVLATQDTVENDSFGDQYDKDATLDFVPVSTAAELKAAVEEGKNISLTQDVQLDECIELTNDLFIQGNGKTLKAPDNAEGQRVVNLKDSAEDHTITLYGVNLEGPTAGTNTRGISFYNNSGKVRVVMDNCSVSANYYAVNVAGLNKDIEITIRNSTITGWCAAQTWSEKSKLTFENCTITGINDKTYNEAGWNNFATIVVNSDAAGSVLNFKNCQIVATQTTGNVQYFLSLRAACEVTLDNCSFVKDGVVVSEDDFKANVQTWTPDCVLTIK